MTCHELHSHFEGCLEGALTPEAVSHLESCAECRGFVDRRQALGRGLHLVRESAPTISESFDASVLAQYRQHTAEKPNLPAHWSSSWAVRWSVVAAAAVIAVSTLWLLARGTRTTANSAKSAQPGVIQAPVTVVSKTVPGKATDQPQRVRHNSKQRSHVKALGPAAIASVHRVPQLPERFRSLMFCDALSCVGDMDVVRVQLPSAFVPRQVSAFPQPTGFVNADVLVGPDGIARGIRVEQ